MPTYCCHIAGVEIDGDLGSGIDIQNGYVVCFNSFINQNFPIIKLLRA